MKLLAKYVFTEHFEMSEVVYGLLENENELTMNCRSVMYGFSGPAAKPQRTILLPFLIINFNILILINVGWCRFLELKSAPHKGLMLIFIK